MITGNEPAMPFTAATETTLTSEHLTGLTIRQHFAAMALSGMCAYMPELGRSHAEQIAKQAVEIADALIAELNK